MIFLTTVPKLPKCENEFVKNNHIEKEDAMNANTNLTVVGFDIAKNVLQLHWIDQSTGEVIRKQLTRAKMLRFFVNRKQCLNGCLWRFSLFNARTN